jgi:hypothetical protein
MSERSKPVVNHATVELKYSNGWSYFDRCGAATQLMLQQLGAPFTAHIPVTRMSEKGTPEIISNLDSQSERIHVQFGLNSLSVQQTGLETAARLEQISALAWDSLAHTLEVRTKVIRCGVRFLLMWPAEDDKFAEVSLLESGLFAETPKWQEVFGFAPRKRAFTAVWDYPDRQVRVNLTAASTQSTDDIPDKLRQFCPPHAVMLDLDWSRSEDEGMKVDKNWLREFFRSSWNHTQMLSEKVGGTLT